jgi:SOS response regulatory protein OraA/RecX
VLDFVSYSARSEKEVKDKLSYYFRKFRKDFPDEFDETDFLISSFERLKDLDYVNDERYVLRYLEGLLLSGKTKSVREAGMFLYKKGIPREISERLLNEKGSELQESAIHILVEKKMRVIGSLNRESRAKLIRYLITKGFDSDAARDAVDRKSPLK